jgi:hypothetical protein
MKKIKDKTYIVVCGDFDKARNVMRKEMYRHYQRDSDEPSVTREIKNTTINGSKIKETYRGNLRLTENVDKNYLSGYIYSRLNPFESIKISWLDINKFKNPSKSNFGYYDDVVKVIIVGNDGLLFYINNLKKSFGTDVEIEVIVY